MLEILQFVFSSFWNWLGAFLFFGVACDALVKIVWAVVHKKILPRKE